MRGNKLKLWTIFALFTITGVYIVGKAANLMLNEADYWRIVEDKFTNDSLSIPAMRGNILSSDGKIMVASVPEYRLLMDFVVIEKDSLVRERAQHWRDSALLRDIDSIATGLAAIFPDKDAAWFRERILQGKKKGSHSWRIYPKWVTYTQYQECKKLPLLRESIYKGGFHVAESMQRKKLYGSLASRTLGDVYRDSDAAKSGLEWCYDTLLRGRNGYAHSTKVRNKGLKFVDLEPLNGHDLVSTIDVGMQDITEKALLDKINEDGLRETTEKAVAILMEVATGDIKALVSLTRVGDTFMEIQNDAINALWEPGSTFKTGSMMVAIEDGYIDTSTVMYCEGGVYDMHGRPMRDHNWRKGGYGDLTVTQILGQSSNIGVSKLIDKYYHDQPEKYVQGLNRIGVGIPLGLTMGADPKVRMPQKKGKQYTNWSNTALAWMSIGYEAQVTPLNTLTFYNAIANNGKMVRPRFAKAEMENGRVVREFPVEVIRERICSPATLGKIQAVLEQVVSKGLGKQAGNRKFRVSGKTGTAQVAENGSYASHKYMVTFCGYFPSEAPMYSCIVCIYKRGTPASGGGQCGPVFSRISQLVMNQGNEREVSEASDSTSIFVPQVAAGNMDDTRQLLGMMNLPWLERNAGDGVWGSVDIDSATHRLSLVGRTVATDAVPDVVGMGARDAVFALQEAGMRVRVSGTGRVVSQSVAAGTRGVQGKTVVIKMR